MIFQLLLWFMAVAFTRVHAQPVPMVPFTPPKARHIGRYESTLSRNPFTLPTAAEPLTRASKLSDWTIASVYGDAAAPTVVVMNMKTHQRYRLSSDKPASNGMRLISATVGVGRKDVLATVDYESQRHELRFNMEWLSQMAAPASYQRSAAPGAVPSGLKVPAAVPPQRVVGASTDISGRQKKAGGTGVASTASQADAAPFFLPGGAASHQQSGAAVPETPSMDVALEADSAPDSHVWTQLDSVAAVPLRRHPRRPVSFVPHPDPQ